MLQLRLALAGLLLLCALSPLAAAQKPVGILISREIAPYIAMVEGFERALSRHRVIRFFLDSQGRAYSLEHGSPELNSGEFSALVAVGPAALRYLQRHAGEQPVAYAMVLNPERISPAEPATTCGLSLNMPITAQLQLLRRYFPHLRRLGVFFDPANNASWYQEARQAAASFDIEIMPLQVRQSSSRLEIIGDLADPDVLLFIPDRTIISRAVIQHVIKQAFLSGTPVVGYNQFFLDSGAAMAFIIDYGEIGARTAALVEDILAPRPCSGAIPPPISAQVNHDVWRALQLEQGGAAHAP
jgi:putative ABC transport system substrate-binding protein